MNRRQFLKIAAASAGLLATYPVFIERYLVQVNHYQIPVPRLPRPFNGFTIVQLTDLHYGALAPLSFLRRVIATANSIPRDVIVCTGDYVHKRNDRKQIDTIWPVLSELNAPLGVYSVLGNHDHWADTDLSLEWLEKSGQNIRNKTHCFEKEGKKLWIAGGGDYWEDPLDFDHVLRDVPRGDCRIVLAHNPDSADAVFTSQVDLMLSGHTHGGQVVVPFYGPPILPVNNKAYSAGLKKSPKGQSVFICRGIGWAIYPVRLNCFPEIAVLELVLQGRRI